MLQKMTKEDVTPGVKSAVNAYLLARTYAETKRKQVNKIEREILKECPLPGREEKNITKPSEAWQCTDENLIAEYYAETNHRLKKVGIKPADMPDDHCPALVAENIQLKTERRIFDNAAEMLKLDVDGQELNNGLLTLGKGNRKKFLDLVVGLVVALPGFKSPLRN